MTAYATRVALTSGVDPELRALAADGGFNRCDISLGHTLVLSGRYAVRPSAASGRLSTADLTAPFPLRYLRQEDGRLMMKVVDAFRLIADCNVDKPQTIAGSADLWPFRLPEARSVRVGTRSRSTTDSASFWIASGLASGSTFTTPPWFLDFTAVHVVAGVRVPCYGNFVRPARNGDSIVLLFHPVLEQLWFPIDARDYSNSVEGEPFRGRGVPTGEYLERLTVDGSLLAIQAAGAVLGRFTTMRAAHEMCETFATYPGVVYGQGSPLASR